MDELKRTVAKNITELRLAANMTQLDLGRELNYSDKAVSKWERGESIPDAYVLLKISRIFGITVDYLLTEHEEKDCPAVVVNKSTPNYVVIALISILGIWTLASLVYVILYLSGIKHLPVFIYAVSVSSLVLTIMNSLWGKKIYNLIYISVFVWSILFILYAIFFMIGHNFWQILLLGIPAQCIVCLCFLVKKKNKIFSFSKRHKIFSHIEEENK